MVIRLRGRLVCRHIELTIPRECYKIGMKNNCHNIPGKNTTRSRVILYKPLYKWVCIRSDKLQCYRDQLRMVTV